MVDPSDRLMESANSSSLYLNTQRISGIVREGRSSESRMMSDKELHVRIETINTVNKLRGEIKGINKCLLYMMVTYVAIIIIASTIVGIVISHSYGLLKDKIDQENEEVYLMLQTLYKKCKENPMDFDWTTQIFRRIEEAEYTIMDKTAQKIMMSFDQRFKNMITTGKIADDSLFKIHIKMDKAEGFEIDAKAAGNEDLQGNQGIAPKPTRRRRYGGRNATPSDPQLTKPWGGPTGIPGVWLSSEEH